MQAGLHALPPPNVSGGSCTTTAYGAEKVYLGKAVEPTAATKDAVRPKAGKVVLQ